MINIKNSIEKASEVIQKEINRFTTKNNGSIFKEAEKLKSYGILDKGNSGKNPASIPETFLEENFINTGDINE